MSDNNRFRGNWRTFRGGSRFGRGYQGRGNRRPGRGKSSRSESRWNAPTEPSNLNVTNPEGSSIRDVRSEENLQRFYKHDARIVDDTHSQGPYVAWKMYIPDEENINNLPLLSKLQVLQDYFRKAGLESNREDIEDKASFVLNYKDISKNEQILKVWPSFTKDIQEMPEKCLSYFGLAFHQLLITSLGNNNSNNNFQTEECTEEAFLTNIRLPKINARLFGFEPQLLLKNLKSNYYGKFVSVKGTIIRVSNVKPLCTKLAFQCGKCGKEFVYSQPYGKYTCPAKCASKGCRSPSFHPLRNSPKTETVNWQSVRLQEITDEQKEVGRMPRSIECELTHDLVDSCVPGDVVSISGTVNVTSCSEGKSKYNKDKCTFVLYILANSVSNCQGKEVSTTGKLSTPIGLELTMKDLYAVQAIQAEENLFKLLCASLCPSIYGHEVVKAGLILGLFGGTQKFVNNNNRIPVRGDPHVLVVGDPGLGKSQMLQACANIAPRGVYVCGNTTSTSGLTVTLCRESGSGGGDYALEAGALVLADQGCCCIDEFDKMTNQHHALLEAMEQQTISIAKAGIVCSLPARTSILAAANPIGGHYNKGKTVSENLKMGSALLSRFDLVFILLDKPDQDLDSKLSEHVMALHSGKGQKSKQMEDFLKIPSTHSTPKSLTQMDKEKPLAERLKYGRHENFDPIPHQLLRKYIAYARKYVRGKISKEAADELQKFYLELRKRLQTSDTTPITTRQLESLIRLTEARARLELREVCTKEDALDVIEIMKQSMIDVWSDDFGALDISRSQLGSGMSHKSMAKKLISLLTCFSERTNNSLFSVQQIKQIAKDASVQIADFDNLLSSLNTQGVLIKKGRGIYKLLSVDY